MTHPYTRTPAPTRSTRERQWAEVFLPELGAQARRTTWVMGDEHLRHSMQLLLVWAILHACSKRVRFNSGANAGQSTIKYLGDEEQGGYDVCCGFLQGGQCTRRTTVAATLINEQTGTCYDGSLPVVGQCDSYSAYPFLAHAQNRTVQCIPSAFSWTDSAVSYRPQAYPGTGRLPDDYN